MNYDLQHRDLTIANRPFLAIVEEIGQGRKDAYRLIVVHEQNHFVQTSRLVQLAGFPAGGAACR